MNDHLAVHVRFTRDFVRDVGGLDHDLQGKAWDLIADLQSGDSPKDVKPGWRFHPLESSPFVSFSLDMKHRVLAKREAGGIILHRAAKHDLAYRRSTLETSGLKESSDGINNSLLLHEVHDILIAFGVPADDARPFKSVTNDDQLLDALGTARPEVSQLALALYETTGVVIPKGAIRLLQQDDKLRELLSGGGDQWQLYLHPSQQFIVDLPVEFRAAVVGSAGTGKTISAWHRAGALIQQERSVGFVCPDQGALSVSRSALANMTAGDGSSYYLVPRTEDELVQLGEVVDHVLIDEGQEIPVTWLTALARKIPDKVGVTLFYDLNQLGGDIERGDTNRYRRRISDWKTMISAFPRMQQLRLAINYRNSREVAQHYLSVLTDALPAAPFAEVPTFESGEVVVHRTSRSELTGVVAGLLRRLLRENESREIGVAAVSGLADRLLAELRDLSLTVTTEMVGKDTTVAQAAAFRGHERKTMIVVVDGAHPVTRKLGYAIDAYIAMSRAIQRLIVVELR